MSHSRVVGVVLYEGAAQDSLARWVHDDVLARDMRARVHTTRYVAVADAAADGDAMLRAACTVLRDECATADKDGEATAGAAAGADDAAATTTTTTAGSARRRQPAQVGVVLLLLAVYWDGQSEASKASFARLKQLADAKGRANVTACSECMTDNDGDAAATATATATTRTTLSAASVHVLVQALNAKKGQHTIPQSRIALLASLERKLDTVAAATGTTKTAAAAVTTTTVRTKSDKGNAADAHADGAPRHVDPTAAAAAATAAADGGDDHGSGNSSSGGAHASSSSLQQQQQLAVTVDVSTPTLTAAVEDGQGECVFALRASTPEQLAQLRQTLLANCAAAQLGAAALLPEPRLVHHNSATIDTTMTAAAAADTSTTATATATAPTMTSTTTGSSSSAGVYVQEYLLRRDRADTHLELRLAMCGNVDSGKSTLTSVLTRGCHDDGRGFARSFVFNHKHEAATGRTSSISENHLGFTATGEVANYMSSSGGSNKAASQQQQQSDAAAGASSELPLAAAVARQYTPQELAKLSAKVLTLYDLAGHEKYLKTTVLGMTRNIPDYACIVISANNGIQRMTREHLVLCLALRLPFFVVVTRIDATPANVLAETHASIHKLLKIPMVRRLPYPVRSPDEVVLAARHLRHDRITPIFEVSNVTGHGVTALLRFLNLLPLRKDWRSARGLPRQMVIDTTFFVAGVGTVVGGVVTQGVFRVNDVVLLGPDGLGHFRPVTIRSIHVRGVDSTHAEAGSDAAFCLKKERRNAIRKGNVLVDPQHPPQAYWQFEAEVTILYHSTTITTNYEPVIHSTTVRQSARITYVAKDVLRTGDRSLVRFHFIYRPEFMLVGQRIIFREGRAKGIGVVTALLTTPDEALLRASKPHRRQALAAGVKLSSAASATATMTTDEKASKRS